jgi:hypothetical protein
VLGTEYYSFLEGCLEGSVLVCDVSIWLERNKYMLECEENCGRA